MRPNRLLLVAAAVTVAAVSAAPAAWAKARRPSPAPAPPPPGWMVDRVRIEPADPGGEVDVAGTGAYRGAIEIGRQPVATATTSATTPATGKNQNARTTTTTSPTTTTRPANQAKTELAGPVAVVNEVALDDYVKGIAEIPSSWPAEALKAQAIAARTYALHELSVGHQLCASDSCQVYAGLAKERAPNGDAWTAAVAATSGQVLLSKNQPILAMYSSSNGGRTVAGSAPYLKAVDDPDDHVSPVSEWHVTIGFDVLTSVFATPKPVLDVHRTAHDTVDLIWNNDDGTTGDLDVPTGEFAGRLNSTQPAPDGLPRAMPSMRFGIVVDQQAGTITIDGQGFGHGIGMSQYGALGKAQRGMKAADILAFYYGGIRPTVAPAKQLPATVRVTLSGAVAAPVTVAGSSPLRITGADGTVLAVRGWGAWQAVPTSIGVRVVAPADQTGPPAVAVTAVDTSPGAPPRVRFRLASGAVVTVSAAAPGQRSVATAPTVLGPCDCVTALPSALPDGDWTVTVTADAGGGRVSAVPAGVHLGAIPIVAQVPPMPAVSAPLRLSDAAASSRGRVVRTQGTPLAVGMTGVALLALLAGVGGVWRDPSSDVTTDGAGLV